MHNCRFQTQSSIRKKQIVAVTGLLLIGFVIGHLAGNLIFFLGPKAFVTYAEKLEHLRPGLYLIEAGLLFIFCVHMTVTALIVLENRRARPVGYAVKSSSEEHSLATKLMPLTGVIIVAFVIWHLLDFTFIDHHGERGVLSDRVNYEIYGVVYNSFTDPLHSLLYIIAMIAVGFHLSHALQSVLQTFGFTNDSNRAFIERVSNGLGILVAVLFSSIPVYVLLLAYA